MKQYRTYSGSDPYLFISYAHRDSDRVLPFIGMLDRDSYRVWYDAGINVGTAWPEVVASHLLNSGKVIFFISKAFLASQNCVREVNYAVSERKDMLCVMLEDVKLPEDLGMQLSVVEKIPLTSGEDTYSRMAERIGSSFVGDGVTGYESVKRTKAGRNVWRILSFLFAALFLASAVFIYGYFSNWFSFAGVKTTSVPVEEGVEIEVSEFKDPVSMGIMIRAFDGTSLYLCGRYMASDPSAIRCIDGDWYAADNRTEPFELGSLGAIASKDSIEYLALVNERISDASALRSMDQLVYLDISGNPVSDISFLEGFDSLQVLKILDTDVTDHSVLSGLEGLKYLYVSYGVLEDVMRYVDTSQVDVIVKR